MHFQTGLTYSPPFSRKLPNFEPNNEVLKPHRKRLIVFWSMWSIFFLWVFFAQIFCARLAVCHSSVLIDRDQHESTKHQRLFCLDRTWNTQTQYSQPYKIESTWTIPSEEDLVWNNPFLENFITLSKWLFKWGEFKLCHKSHQLVKLTKDSFGALSKYSITSVLSQSLKPLFLVCFVKLWLVFWRNS